MQQLSWIQPIVDRVLLVLTDEDRQPTEDYNGISAKTFQTTFEIFAYFNIKPVVDELWMRGIIQSIVYSAARSAVEIAEIQEGNRREKSGKKSATECESALRRVESWLEGRVD